MRHVMHIMDGVVSHTQCTYVLDCCSYFETHSYLQRKKNIYFSTKINLSVYMIIYKIKHEDIYCWFITYEAWDR